MDPTISQFQKRSQSTQNPHILESCEVRGDDCNSDYLLMICRFEQPGFEFGVQTYGIRTDAAKVESADAFSPHEQPGWVLDDRHVQPWTLGAVHDEHIALPARDRHRE